MGWVKPVIENVRTGHLIDGHERIWQALQNDDADVPYIQIDVSEEQEAEALLFLDSVGALAVTDVDSVEELLQQINTEDANMNAFMGELAHDAGLEYAFQDGFDFGNLPSSDRAPFQQITFTLHDEQAKLIKDKLRQVKKEQSFIGSKNQNSNGNALAYICENYVS